MTISLTVLMEEETLYDDLYTGNICTLLVETENFSSIVNPGGTPRALAYNISKLIKNIEKKVNVIITTFIPRYWSALSVICKIFNIDKIIIPRPKTYISYRFLKYVDKIYRKNIIEVIDEFNINSLKILNVSSATYSELVLIFENSLMISTPSLWMILQGYANTMIINLELLKPRYYVGGVPLLPDIVRDHAIFIRRFFSNFDKVYIGNIRTKSSKNVLDRLPIDIKILRVGSRVTLSFRR